MSGPPSMLLATCKWIGTLSESHLCPHTEVNGLTAVSPWAIHLLTYMIVFTSGVGVKSKRAQI